jgi:hypothetical protein
VAIRLRRHRLGSPLRIPHGPRSRNMVREKRCGAHSPNRHGNRAASGICRSVIQSRMPAFLGASTCLLKKSIKRELRPAGLPWVSARAASIYSQNDRLWKGEGHWGPPTRKAGPTVFVGSYAVFRWERYQSVIWLPFMNTVSLRACSTSTISVRKLIR